MDDKDKTDAIFESLDNCWRALCRRMKENPTADTQRIMNYLARIIETAKSESRKREREAIKQMSIEEWMAWFSENNN